MISIISDVHIKKKGDDAYHLFLSFLNHEKVKSSHKVILLGDIFDLLVGGDKNFYKEYKEIFVKINELMNKGVEVYYLEGNHDFHIGNFLNKYLGHENFNFSPELLKIEHLGKSILLSHGDDIEIENPSYKIYSKIIRSVPIQILAERIVPFSITKSIGDWASSRSRKKNLKKYNEKSTMIRDKFRRSVEEFYQKVKFDVVVTGHSHVKDNYESPQGFKYLNNGFAQSEKTFIFINHQAEFISLS